MKMSKEADKITQSIYDQILAALQLDGTLPDSFSVQPPKSADEILVVDGCWDGICCYHNKLETPDISVMKKILRKISTKNFGSAESILDQFFSYENNTMLAYIDKVQKWIFDHAKELDAENLCVFAKKSIIDISK